MDDHQTVSEFMHRVQEMVNYLPYFPPPGNTALPDDEVLEICEKGVKARW